jgi:phage portal protein BeeE
MDRDKAEQKRLRQEAERFAARARKVGNPLLRDEGDSW